MYIIIVGCGRFGSSLAKELADEENNICVIERNAERLEALGNNYNGKKIRGIEFDDDILREAGIEEADAVIAASSDDNINITVALIAQKIYKVPTIIARVNNPEKNLIYQQLHIDTVNPVKYEVDILKDKLMIKGTDCFAVMDNDFEIIKLSIQRTDNLSIEELETKFQCRIPAISRKGNIELCQKDQHLHAEDKAICMVQKENKKSLINYICKEIIR